MPKKKFSSYRKATGEGVSLDDLVEEPSHGMAQDGIKV